MDGAATTSVLLTRQPGQPARVFTAGLPGLLQERDLHSGAVLASCDSFGGAVWAMASQQSSGDDGMFCVCVCIHVKRGKCMLGIGCCMLVGFCMRDA